MAPLSTWRLGDFVVALFGDRRSTMRVESMANGVVGITVAAVFSIHAIGQAYARAAGITGESGVKLIDRFWWRWQSHC